MLVEEIYGDLQESGDDGAPARRRRLTTSPLAWLAARVDTAALAASVQAFTVSRVVLLVVTYVAMALHPTVWGHNHPSSKTLWDAWYQWDARWYVRVARSGYHWYDFHHWASVAFFPFYPILILVLVTVLPVSTKLVAIIISNALFFAALYALYRLVRREFNGEIAGRTVLYLSVFPTALFFFAGYSESPFLLWSILSISAMRQRRWAWAGIWGCLAAATRSQGLVLGVPFLVEWWAAYGPRRYTLVDHIGSARRLLIVGLRWRDLAQVLWVALIPAGWVLLAIYMQWRFANPLLFIQVQEAWNRTTTWPWYGLWLTLQHISWQHIATPESAHNAIELLTVTIFSSLIALGWRQLPRSLSLYAIVSMLVILVNPASLDNYYLPLMSVSRLCLAIFPCFIALAIRGSWEPLDRLVTTLGPALLAVFTVVFLQGAWVA